MKGEEYHIHKELIERCQRNDREAQSKLYGLYARAMYNICRRMMGDDEEAQDLLQESFIDAFQKLPSLRDTSFFSSWIKRIVINHCINAIRKKRLLTTVLEDEFDQMEEVEDFSYQEYRAQEIMGAIEQLPEGCRTVLNLYLFEGYDHKEIGHILSITESASKAQYSKARARVRKLLEDKQQAYAG